MVSSRIDGRLWTLVVGWQLYNLYREPLLSSTEIPMLLVQLCCTVLAQEGPELQHYTPSTREKVSTINIYTALTF